jgi:hypothetical protein
MTALTNPKSFGGKDKVPFGYQKGQLSQFTPEQMQLFQSAFGPTQQGLTGGLEHLASLARGGTPEMWQQLEAPAMRQFIGTQGQLASRFSGMGTGARRSSGFGLASSGAAQDLAERLQSQRLGLQQNAIQQLMGFSQQLLGQRPYERFLTKSPWLSLGEGLATGVGQGLGMAATGGI